MMLILCVVYEKGACSKHAIYFAFVSSLTSQKEHASRMSFAMGRCLTFDHMRLAVLHLVSHADALTHIFAPTKTRITKLTHQTPQM